MRHLRRIALLAALAVAAGGLATSGAHAACNQFAVPAAFVAVQNNGYWVTFYLNQRGSQVWGKAGYAVAGRSWKLGPKKTKVVVGNVTGGISGNRLFLRSFWTYSGVSSIGVYMGEIAPDGTLVNGITYDQMATPAIASPWTAQQRLGCAG